jgi:hypothetical protein
VGPVDRCCISIRARRGVCRGYGGETARFAGDADGCGAKSVRLHRPLRCGNARPTSSRSTASSPFKFPPYRTVAVSANQITTVPADGFRATAKPIEPAQLRGTVKLSRSADRRDGLDKNNDRAGTVSSAPTTVEGDGRCLTPVTGPYLKPDVPGQTLLQTLSPDMRANTQPLPQYRRVKPNNSPQPLH